MAKLKDTEINGNLAVDGDVIVNGNQVLDSANVGSYAIPINNGVVDTSVQFNSGFNVGHGGWFGSVCIPWDGKNLEFYNAFGNQHKAGWIGPNGGTKQIYISSPTYVIFHLDGSGDKAVMPNADGAYRLGESWTRWSTIFSTNGAIHTSDRNKKENIETLSDKYEMLFNDLKPVSFKLKSTEETTHNRKHIGFISQDIEESMNNIGLSALDFGGFCKDVRKKENEETKEFVEVLDENGEPIYDYSLRYSEFIALNTHMIQKQQKEIESLKEENNKLKEDFNTLKEEIEILKNLYKQSSN